jgi:hypothetical protein
LVPATVHIAGQPAVKMPCFEGDGAEIGARLGVALEGKSCFKRRRGRPARITLGDPLPEEPLGPVALGGLTRHGV